MYYRPVLNDNRTAPLPWQIKTFFINMVWPLQDNIKHWVRLVNLCLISAEFFAIGFVILGSLRFIIKYHRDINLSIEALVTFISLIECSVKMFHMTVNRGSFKLYSKSFYSTIFFDEKENPEVCRKIRRRLIPTTIFSYGYILTLISFLTMPILSVILGKRTALSCSLTVDYDLENSVNYMFTVFILVIVGVCLLLFFIGEAFFWANCILHLNARYRMIQDQMLECSSHLIETVPLSRLAFEFRKNILRTFVKVCDLNRFSVLFDAEYNFRIFVTIFLSALMVCVLCYQILETGHSSKKLGYVAWLLSRLSELLIFGTLGSTFIDTTDKISTMYYLSNWEEVIYRSTDKKQNILLLKDLQIVMLLHHKPIQMNGLNILVVSLPIIEKVLRVSGSYFAFLYTIKQSTMT